MVLITARMGRIGTNLLNRGDRRVISKRGSLYKLFVACFKKNVEDFITDTQYKLMSELSLMALMATKTTSIKGHS